MPTNSRDSCKPAKETGLEQTRKILAGYQIALSNRHTPKKSFYEEWARITEINPISSARANPFRN